MSPFHIISVEPKTPIRKRRAVKTEAVSKPRPRRKAVRAMFATQADEWAVFRGLYAADVATRLSRAVL